MEGKMIEDVRTLLREREGERKQSSNGAEESNQGERTGMKKWQGGRER